MTQKVINNSQRSGGWRRLFCLVLPSITIVKDSYLLEFLDLPPKHSEADLQRGLVEKLRQFLIELGHDFCFVGSDYPLQVGGRDFAIDLLFFNRALNALVGFELKTGIRTATSPDHLSHRGCEG